MKTIYFHQKPFHRERQKNTVDFSKKYFEVLSPFNGNIEEIDNIKIANKQPFFYKIISFIVGKIPLINLRFLPKKSENADIIYTWGDIPLFSKNKFVIELDNPYVLTFYNYFAFKIYKFIIKQLLKSDKCKAIVCISEACKNTFINEFGEELKSKTKVLYPRVKTRIDNKNKGDIVKFLFVGFGGKGKGLFDLLDAFSQIENSKISLDIIGFRTDDIVKKYNKDKRISFLGQIKRNEVLDKMAFYDVLVFPTYFESLGMVALEALSRGLGIITTNVYALPELVKDSYNGKIIKIPYLEENKYGYVEVVRMKSEYFYKKYLKTDTNKNFTESIKNSIEISIKEYKVWKENSKKIYEEKFSEKAWEKAFLNIFK